MRNLLCVLLIPMLGFSCYCQNKQILYGFDDIPQSLLVNPAADMSQDIHVGMPFLSQIHFAFGSSGVSAYDVFGNSGGDINTRIGGLINGISKFDFFTLNEQIEIVSFGWKDSKERYWSGGMYQELDFISYFPKDWAILAWDGNASHLEERFQFRDISFTAELLSVMHFGVNKKFGKKLRLGARAKLYSNIAHASSTGNEGVFITRELENSPNIYKHRIVNANVTVRTSGIQNLSESENANQVINKVIGRAFLGGNLGVGLDVGGEYEIGRNWKVSASAIDIGAVFHTNDVETYEATGTHNLDGIELLFPPLSEGESTFEYYDNVEDNFETDIPVDTITSSYVQLRPLKLNAAIKYGFGEGSGSQVCDCLDKSTGTQWREEVGLQLYSIMRPKRPQYAVTAFYLRRFGDYVAAKATYTVDAYSATNVGLGVSSNFGPVNFYVAVDNILTYSNIAKAKNVSLQLGFNVKLDKE